MVLLHPLAGRPQVIGISRHISGAYSILDLNWDDRDQRLSGLSEGVPGKDYHLFIYLPNQTTIASLKASTTGGGQIVARQDVKGNLLKVTFQGQAEPVHWQAEFGAEVRK